VQLAVGTVGRAHGLRGEVAVDVRTDRPDERFAVGRALASDRGTLVVTGARRQGVRWYLTFEGVGDRTAAEGLRGTELRVELEESPEPAEDDAWYPHELAGLRVELTDGTVVGEVTGLEHLPAQDALVVRESNGTESLVPFVRAIVPVVDVPGGRVVIDPPAGLLAGVGEPELDLPSED
jgi:16S rRNA processing protein RimM